MTSEAKINANRLNSKRSTGPNTIRGKLKSKANALTLGIYSVSCTLPGEAPGHWKRFREATITDINPVGAVETAIAERLTLILWKQKRLSAHEVAVTADHLNKLEKEKGDLQTIFRKLEKELDEAKKSERYMLSKRKLVKLMQQGTQRRVDEVEAYNLFEAVAQALNLDEFDPHDGAFLKLYEDETQELGELDPFDVIQWSVNHLLKGVDYLAGLKGRTREQVIHLLMNELKQDLEANKTVIVKLRADLREESAKREQLVALHVIPDEARLVTLMRYEAHLNRQMTASLHSLLRLQAGRLSNTSTVPVAIDISLTRDCPNKRTDRLHEEEQGSSITMRQLKQVEAIAQPMGC
ncbi:MAG: hypothetical protein U0796_19135 [Gemmatales bacterium]